MRSGCCVAFTADEQVYFDGFQIPLVPVNFAFYAGCLFDAIEIKSLSSYLIADCDRMEGVPHLNDPFPFKRWNL